MVTSDLKHAKRHALLKKLGYEVNVSLSRYIRLLRSPA
jgi:hypothetical protein